MLRRTASGSRVAAALAAQSLPRNHRCLSTATRAGMTRYKDFLSTYTPPPDADLEALRALERKSIWLSTYMIHNANNLREKRDGLKVGGHQASSSSMATILTALYWHHMLPQDRTAVKPHASPIFHSIQYLAGRQSLDQLNRFRGFGGVQSYPSRTCQPR